MKNVWHHMLIGALSAASLIGGAQAQEGDGAFAPGAGRMVRGTVTAVRPRA